jgi:hypothetical protein
VICFAINKTFHSRHSRSDSLGFSMASNRKLSGWDFGGGVNAIAQ